jgi:putative transposase
VARFLTTSDGEVVANPRFLDATRERIADLQRRKARARPGSGNCRRLRRALAKEWRKVRYQRRDFHHKTARALVESNDAIALEDLHVDSLTASARGTVEVPGRNVAAKAGLTGRSWTPAGPSSRASFAGPAAPGHGRTSSSALFTATGTPT